MAHFPDFRVPSSSASDGVEKTDKKKVIKVDKNLILKGHTSSSSSSGSGGGMLSIMRQAFPGNFRVSAENKPLSEQELKEKGYEGFYLMAMLKLQKLDLDPTLKQTAGANLLVFSEYSKNLPAALAGLPNEVLNHDQLMKITGKLHHSVGSHVTRLQNPIPQKVRAYIEGFLGQIEQLYTQVKNSETEAIYFKGVGQSLSCFEDRIADSYKYITEELEKLQLLTENKRAEGNSDPVLPATFNVTNASSNDVLNEYYKVYSQKGNGTLADFKTFLKTTLYSQLNPSDGPLNEEKIQRFADFINLE